MRTWALLLLLCRSGLASPGASVLDQSAANAAAGGASSWDFSAVDLTFKSRRREVWVLDGHCQAFPEIKVFRADDLRRPPRSLPILLPGELEGAAVLGLAENLEDPTRSSNILVADPNFGEDGPPAPRLGLIDDEGEPVSPFGAVGGLPFGASITSIDVDEASGHIAAYDLRNRAIWLIEFAPEGIFDVVGGPFVALGLEGFFAQEWSLPGSGCASSRRGAGRGICWLREPGSERALLVPGGFNSRFEADTALRYDFSDDLQAGPRYTGQALDLSGARHTEFSPDTLFVSLDAGVSRTSESAADRPTVFALNFADEAVYAFDRVLGDHALPVSDLICETRDDPRGGFESYTLTWNLDPNVEIDAIAIFENGARIARLQPEALSFTSPHPPSGRLQLEVVTERGGLASRLRATCVVRNTRLPVFPEDEEAVEPATQVRGFRMSACAVTKAPERPQDFRAYLVGRASNRIEVFDHRLRHLDSITTTPQITREGRNDAALGIALVETEEGERALAILDADGPDGDGAPHVDLHALEPGPAGEPVGRRLYRTEPIDLSLLAEEPFLFDIDIDSTGHFVAGGRAADGRFVLVRLLWDQTQRTIRATAQVDGPFSSLSASADARGAAVQGVGVSVLPNDYLLVVGGDEHQRSYSDALLMTPFRDETPDGEPRLVGFASGLPRPGAFFSSYGPEFGPGLVFSLATAWFGDEIGSVCYLPTVDIELLANPAADEVLQVNGNLFLQARADAELGNPGLVADQILAERFTLGPRSGGGDRIEDESTAAFTIAPERFADLDSRDLVIYVINESLTDDAAITVTGDVGRDDLDELPDQVEIEPGRYYRALMEDVPGGPLDLSVRNLGARRASLRMLVGSRGIDPRLAAGVTRFRRGDCDADGEVRITDAIFALGHLFAGGAPSRCLDACDVDDSGSLNLSDAVATLQYLFLSLAPPPEPGPELCGVDPTSDLLPACEPAGADATCD